MDRRMRLISDGKVYQCCYCSQRCTSVAILASHEGDCPRRRIKEKEWQDEVRKHAIRYSNMKRRKEI